MGGRREIEFGGREKISNQVFEQHESFPNFIFSDFEGESSGLDSPVKMRVAEIEDQSSLFQTEDLARGEMRPEIVRTGQSGRR